MKKTILAFSLLAIGGTASFAQCDRKVILTSSQTEYLDAKGTVQRTIDEKSIIEISKTEITITDGGNPGKSATIKSADCKWSVPFKEGKMEIKASFVRGVDTNKMNIIIEGKEGRVFLLMKVEEMPDRVIRVVADTFEEQK